MLQNSSDWKIWTVCLTEIFILSVHISSQTMRTVVSGAETTVIVQVLPCIGMYATLKTRAARIVYL